MCLRTVRKLLWTGLPAHVCGRIVRLLIAICLTGALSGQSRADEALSLDQCIAVALERHPVILASADRHQAGVARIRQAKALPVPSIGFNSDLQPHLADFVNSEEAYLGVSQTLELPHKRTARMRIAEQESRELATDIEVVKLEVIFQVRRSFYEVLLAQEKLGYARQDLALAEDYLQQAELKLAAGDVGRVEALRARVEALNAANGVKAAVNDVNLARARLNYHLARGKSAPIQVVGQLQIPFIDLDLGKLQAEALRLRPELQRLRLSMDKEKLVQNKVRLSNLPDLDFNLSRHRLQGVPTTWSFTVSAPLSFLFQQRQKAEMAESQANARALQRESEQSRNTVLLEIQEAHSNAQKAQDQILLYQGEILPQAQEVMEMFTFSYKEGEIGGIELIEARRTLNQSRKSYADALFEHALALATVEKAVGRRP
jgi:cobalt-zinc-cadmium efflux system outer membrane protein